MKQIMKDTLILFCITAVAGILLAVVNELTKGPIAEQEAQLRNEAFQAVFADAQSFEPIALADAGQDSSDSANSNEAFITFTQAHPKSEINEVNGAYDATGNLLGYVITVTNKEGYGGEIQFVMGIRMDGTLNGVSILSTNETVGLGLEAENVLIPQFAGKKVESFVYTKTGAAADNEIDAISSATITTNAFTNGVNTGLAYFYTFLVQATEEGGTVNE